MGGGHPHAARLAVYVTFVMAIAVGAAVGLITILVRKVWGRLYSNEEEVVKYITTMMPVLAISNFMDGIQCVLSGLKTTYSQLSPAFIALELKGQHFDAQLN